MCVDTASKREPGHLEGGRTLETSRRREGGTRKCVVLVARAAVVSALFIFMW